MGTRGGWTSIWNKTTLKFTKLRKSSGFQIVGCWESTECKYYVLALFSAVGVNLWPVLGQNTGLALWSEAAQLFIGFCRIKKNSQTIQIPNQRYGCFQAQHTVRFIMLLSAHIYLNRTLLIEFRPLTHHYKRFL